MNSYILSLALIMPTPAHVGNEQDAYKHIGKALYKELKLDKEVKKVEKYIEKNYVPEEIKPYVGYTGVIIRAVVEKRISYEWRF